MELIPIKSTIFARVIAAVVAVGIALLTAGCREDDGSGYIFKYDISANPQTLDPQMANDPNAETIIRNVYMGLLCANADGSLSAGCAEDWYVSDDGLVYKFRLRQDIFWIDSDDFERQCTAEDFVYGFWRLFIPETKAPRAEEYFCIKNAERVNKGAVKDKSQLGVKATGEFELEITLETPNPRFALLLSEPPAMPCNEEFFLESQGRYGLDAECTPSNGAFYVKSWNYDPYTITDNNNLILRRNNKNSAAKRVYPGGLNFFIEDESDFVSDFITGTTSCIAVTDEGAAQISGEFNVERFSNITTGLIFNRSFELFKNEDFLRAMSLLANREAIGKALAHFDTASDIVPAQVSMLDKGYRELVGTAGERDYNAAEAKRCLENALPLLDRELFIGARILVPDSTAADAVSFVMQEWQGKLGFYCVVEVAEGAEYRRRLESGDFELAVVDLSGSYNSPAAYLSAFRRGDPVNYGGFFDIELEQLMERAEVAADLSESAELYFKAEQLVLERVGFVPLYYKNEYFYTDPDTADIIYNPFSKTVDFSAAKRF